MSRPRPTPKLRKEVATRANYHCEYCQALRSYSPSPFDVEHIQPYCLGGLLVLTNLAYACHGCNSEKSDKIEAYDPVSNELQTLFNPRINEWTTHFSWSEDNLLIIGITPIGRTTVEALLLNRQELINLREVLILVGKHPPNFTLI